MQTSTPPYQDLHIYYFDGLVPLDSVIRNHPDLIGNWEEENTSFLFFAKQSDEVINDLRQKNPNLTLIDKFEMSYEQWQGDHFSGFTVGQLTIVPAWETQYDVNDNNLIRLDPGVVFGQGSHPTTKDCLLALDYLSKNIWPQIGPKYAPERAIDLGTGTGILALAADAMGCQQVVAIDLNYLAAQTAHKNCMLNKRDDHIMVVCGQAEQFLTIPADLFIANIHYDIMKNFFLNPQFYNKSYYILSGLLRSQGHEAAFQLKNNGFKSIKSWERDGIWCTYLLHRDKI